jgi:hypothetical protein
MFNLYGIIDVIVRHILTLLNSNTVRIAFFLPVVKGKNDASPERKDYQTGD